MIKMIFLDMDGVITDFLSGLHKALGVPYDINNYLYEKGKWDMLCDIKTGIVETCFTFQDCNNCCTAKFWAELLWMHDGRDILGAILETFGLGKIYLLTTPMPNLQSASGKMIWVSLNLPIYLKRTIITQAPKELLARPDALLIDDKDKNIDEFVSSGGQGILVPRPWNRAYKQMDNSANVVRECLEALC